MLLSFVGCIAFIGVAAYFLTRPSIEIQWQEKAVFSAFFAGAILCMGFSFLFHTMYCHSERVGKLFNKYVVNGSTNSRKARATHIVDAIFIRMPNLFHSIIYSSLFPVCLYRLDYCGIALLTVGSFVPWLYYSFYCRLEPKITYLALIFILGIICIIVSMWDKFAEPKFRPVRAGEFYFAIVHPDNGVFP